MRKSLIAAGTLAFALALGACGEETTAGQASPGETFTDPASLVSAATASTQEKKSAHFTMDMNMGTMSATGEGQGLFDGENTKMAMTMNMDMSAMGQGNMAMEMRLLDDTMYMKMPNMPGMDTSKPWIKMDLAQMSALGGVDMSKTMKQNDPTKALEMLKDSGDITSTEESDVGGVPATKYTIDVDVEKMMSQYGSGMGKMFDTQNMKLDALPVEVWISEEQLPLKFQMNMGELMNSAMESSGQPMPEGMNFDDAHVAMTYSDWGEPVTIEAPPASEVNEGNFPGGN
ncbi:DUF6612 family protein [Haloechinothrix halophila]|uniref:DUF6612 family protein n=1 Tax=Haloechinothrix halophila TaxID=1069073 RepID=UPI00041B6754|nr:DUF6612 family protein [Haloechinothrix halophila]